MTMEKNRGKWQNYFKRGAISPRVKRAKASTSRLGEKGSRTLEGKLSIDKLPLRKKS